jgi:hypothetical protein
VVEEGGSRASYRARSMAARGCLDAMRDSSAVARGLNWGSRRGGRMEASGADEDDDDDEESSVAMRDSAAARSEGEGSGSMSGGWSEMTKLYKDGRGQRMGEVRFGLTGERLVDCRANGHFRALQVISSDTAISPCWLKLLYRL